MRVRAVMRLLPADGKISIYRLMTVAKLCQLGNREGLENIQQLRIPREIQLICLQLLHFPLLVILISADWTAQKRLTRVCGDVIERPAR